MARVPDEEVERLKRETSVRRLAEAKGVSFVKSGDDNLLGRCPFHDDKTPSLVVSEKKNLWHCLGACRAGGSVIDFVMKAEGVNFRHAIELLREGVDLSGPVGPRKATVPRLPSPVDAEADDVSLMAQVRDYYHSTLKASPEALAYLESRGLKHAEAIETFRLGYSNRTLGLRLPYGNREAGAQLRGRLQRLGVLRETGHEHLRGCVVVPLHDESGAVTGMYGRRTSTPLSGSAHLYLPGPHRVAFNSAGLSGQRTAILCEAVIDALSFWCAGFRNVTAAYGVEGFTQHHLEALRRHGVKDVVIAYDRDDAGDAAAESLSRRLNAEGFGCWRVLFPRGMDANEYACKVRPAAKALGVALRQATWMGAGLPPGTPGFVEIALPSLVAEPPVPKARGTETERSISEGEKRIPSTTAARVVMVDPTPPPVPASNTTPTAEAPTAQALVVHSEEHGEEVQLHFGPRRYRVRGLAKALSPETMKVNLLVSQGEAFHVDTVDMYSARQRTAFLRAASEELRVPEEVLRKDVGAMLLKLEELQEAHLKAKLSPKKTAPTLSDEERAAALELLQHPRFLDVVVDDFEKCGVVGEETNKLVGYLAAVSRKLDEPLAVLIQSSSAAGKSSLMEAVLAFVPEEDKTKYSAMTGQSLFYMGDADLKHKVLAVVEEEGAARASYALKLLQSEGELTIASTGKDPATGKLVTHEYRVEGPTQLFLTTTASELDEELLNRCLVLTVDEEREQTRAIHEKQREKQTLEGLLARRDRDAVLKLHQNAQRLLRPLAVVNPFARQLTFLDDRTRARRDFPKYLTLIRVIALLHQYQRPVKTVQHHGKTVEYLEVTLNDIAVANRLAHAVLGRSLDDLPPQTRRLLSALDGWVARGCTLQGGQRGEYRFTRRQLREALNWGDTQLKLHLGRLLELEYLRLHRSGTGGFEYVLLYAGQGVDGGRFLVGLADVANLGAAHQYDASKSESGAAQSGASRPLVGLQSALSRGVLVGEKANGFPSLAAVGVEDAGTTLPGSAASKNTYTQVV